MTLWLFWKELCGTKCLNMLKNHLTKLSPTPPRMFRDILILETHSLRVSAICQLVATQWDPVFRATSGAAFTKVLLQPTSPVCLFASVCVYLCACVCVLVWTVWGGGYYCFSLVAVQPCLFCGTSVGCVMGFVEPFSDGGVKQAQSRALPDTVGTSGRVSLRLRTHAHLTTPYSTQKHKERSSKPQAEIPDLLHPVVFPETACVCFSFYWHKSTFLIHFDQNSS